MFVTDEGLERNFSGFAIANRRTNRELYGHVFNIILCDAVNNLMTKHKMFKLISV